MATAPIKLAKDRDFKRSQKGHEDIREAVLELEERAAGEVASVLQGRMPDNLVNPEVLSHSRAGLPAL